MISIFREYVWVCDRGRKNRFQTDGRTNTFLKITTRPEKTAGRRGGQRVADRRVWREMSMARGFTTSRESGAARAKSDRGDSLVCAVG